jgi:hypothetical protein
VLFPRAAVDQRFGFVAEDAGAQSKAHGMLFFSATGPITRIDFSSVSGGGDSRV